MSGDIDSRTIHEADLTKDMILITRYHDRNVYVVMVPKGWKKVVVGLTTPGDRVLTYLSKGDWIFYPLADCLYDNKLTARNGMGNIYGSFIIRKLCRTPGRFGKIIDASKVKI